MSDQRIIHQADISKIEWNLGELASGLDQVHSRVHQVNQEVATIDARLEQLMAEFDAFVQQDRRQKQLQLAETRLLKVRQQLEHEFGHYGEVRRHTTGILQATDVGVIRQDTITTATEELMLAAPRYWLAPCLVTLAAWISDDRPLAERAVMEAERRNREKTTLFFALVCRRLGRHEAASAWISRYFALQDPTELARETVVMVDAVAGGIFGGDARRQCTQTIEAWIAELAGRAGFVEAQRDQWRSALLSRMTQVDVSSYHYLPKYSATWGPLQGVLRSARLHESLIGYFRGIYNGAVTPATSIVAAADALLDKLVTEFDAEELPLRRDERLYSLIVEADGDNIEAERRAGQETEALASQVSFTQLLANAAMHPETSHASRETQRYAIALSRAWIADAHRDLTAQIRASVPLDVHLQIDDWSGSTRDGSNEEELARELNAHLTRKEVAEVEQVKLGPVEYGAVGLGGAIALFALFSQAWFFVLVGLAGVGWFFYVKSQLETRKQSIRDRYAKLQTEYQAILKACLAEVVDWRRAFAQADGHAPEFAALLEEITPDQFVLSTHDRGRAVVGAQG